MRETEEKKREPKETIETSLAREKTEISKAEISAREQRGQECTLCPRMCRVRRDQGEKGCCRESSRLVVARAALHMWEETCISGTAGSGAVFFSGCSMGCIFCQNNNIAAGRAGKVISVDRLGEIFLELQAQGANNINLVTPTHYVPQIVEALNMAKGKGLQIPIVYNTSGYERVETLRMLKGYVDIYLPDFKYMEEGLGKEYSRAGDYPKIAMAALAEMVEQTGDPVFDPKTGLMKKGVIVRHLVLPGHVKNSRAVLRYLYETYGDSIYISIMNQYTPMPQVKDHPLLCRKVTAREYGRVLEYAIELGIENGFFQTGETAKESFIPEFDGEGV